MSRLSVEAIFQAFSFLSYDDQNEALKKIFINMNLDRRAEFLEKVFGEQKVHITVKGGVAEVDEVPANITVEIDDLD